MTASTGYSRRVDRHHPGLIVFMIDQSNSMSDAIAGAGAPKAAVVADQLNGIMFELIQRCSKSHSEPPRPYFGVSVIGYRTDQRGNQRVDFGLSGDLAGRDMVWTTDLALNPLRIEQRHRDVPGQGPVPYRFPVWLDPVAEGGTPMCAGFNLAGRVVRSWVDRFPDAFPPIVINLTDGESTDGDPAVWAERIRALSTSDGSTLLFNVGISDRPSHPLMFPHDPSQVSTHYGQQLFAMSSVLPTFMVEAARLQGFQMSAGARGFALDADMRTVMTFLNIGTSVGHLLR